MRTRSEHQVETPIASLIDVVFLLIIFFVVTAAVDKDVVDETITLAQANYSPAVEKKDPNTITINVQKDGSLNIAMQPLSLSQLHQILAATVHQSGNNIPILIRSDANTLYNEVDKVMEVVGKAGLYRVRIAAIASEN